MSDELKIAIEAAESAGEEALKYYNKSIDIVFKEDDTPVTIADQKAEEVIIKHISDNIPKSNFVAEESGGEKMLSDFWTVDPIDGTRSFSRGVPGWCVLISHYKEGTFRIGVCYFPVSKEMLYAETGKGAYLNKRRIHVSKISKLAEAYTAFGNPKYIKNKNIIDKLTTHSAAVRSWESTYSLSLVAQGKADVLVDGYRQIWDNGPFAVVLPEAGGRITKLDGDPLDLDNRGCIATNGLIHDEVVSIYNEK